MASGIGDESRRNRGHDKAFGIRSSQSNVGSPEAFGKTGESSGFMLGVRLGSHTKQEASLVAIGILSL